MDKYVNVDFRIVVDYRNQFKNESRKKNRHLIGRSGLLNLIGRDLYLKAISRAYRENSEKITIKLRRGINIIFYAK